MLRIGAWVSVHKAEVVSEGASLKCPTTTYSLIFVHSSNAALDKE